mgnify:CR=1 FL=1|tara:strand:+ start:2623 stop:2841 length:219 start_codon:yes stop_codon:yes gene_type:complete
MNNKIFAIEISAILKDGTEVTDVTGLLIDNKRVYKLLDDTILTGEKKIKTFKSILYTIPAEILPYIMSKRYD